MPYGVYCVGGVQNVDVERFCLTIKIFIFVFYGSSRQTTSKYSRVNHVDTDLSTPTWMRIIGCPCNSPYYIKPSESLLMANILIKRHLLNNSSRV